MNPIKCKYSDIKAIMSWYERFGDQYEDIKDLIGTQPHAHCIAYYTPSQANWSYRIELVKYNDNVYEVVTVFSEVKAAMPIWL